MKNIAVDWALDCRVGLDEAAICSVRGVFAVTAPEVRGVPFADFDG